MQKKYLFNSMRTTLSWAVLMSLFFISGCATTNPSATATPSTKNTEEKVAKVLSCSIAALKEPNWALDALPNGADNVAFVKALIAEIEQRKAYEQQLKDILQECVRIR